MLMRIVPVFIVFLFTISACAVLETSEATHMLSGQSFPATDADSVSVYLEKPNFDYMVIGTVEARGIGLTTEKRDQELAVKALKKEAASIGAHGVIITDSNQQIASVTKNSTSTERRIKAQAIRRK